MKKYKSEPPRKKIKFNANRRPDIRDNLDNRKNEEQDFKGDDITHNMKEVHNSPKKNRH